MSDKIAVVYIGDKPSKKDTVTGSRLVFPRHTAVDVESHIAMQLLEFPSVWIRHEALAGELERQETTAQAAAEAGFDLKARASRSLRGRGTGQRARRSSGLPAPPPGWRACRNGR